MRPGCAVSRAGVYSSAPDLVGPGEGPLNCHGGADRQGGWALVGSEIKCVVFPWIPSAQDRQAWCQKSWICRHRGGLLVFYTKYPELSHQPLHFHVSFRERIFSVSEGFQGPLAEVHPGYAGCSPTQTPPLCLGSLAPQSCSRRVPGGAGSGVPVWPACLSAQGCVGESGGNCQGWGSPWASLCSRGYEDVTGSPYRCGPWI